MPLPGSHSKPPLWLLLHLFMGSVLPLLASSLQVLSFLLNSLLRAPESCFWLPDFLPSKPIIPTAARYLLQSVPEVLTIQQVQKQPW